MRAGGKSCRSIAVELNQRNLPSPRSLYYIRHQRENIKKEASNAGDDFHLIWAGKKLLDILKPNSNLTAISVEGPTWADSIEIDDEQKLYSID